MAIDSRSLAPSWSHRILIMAAIGIVYFTLFPFRFNFHRTPQGEASPFLLGPSAKHVLDLDFFLNVLLFVPLGVGLCAWLRPRSLKRGTGLALALATGIVVSYTIEFLQLYVPLRSSGWDDIFSNSLGCVVGFALCQSWGEELFARLSRLEWRMQRWLSVPRAALILIGYFLLWLAVSLHFQQQSRLSNWDDLCPLTVGNDFSGAQAWQGTLFRLRAWNRPVPESRSGLVSTAFAQSFSQSDSQSTPQFNDLGPLVEYDFSSGPPFADRRNLMPPLAERSASVPQPQTGGAGFLLSRHSWLSTSVPVSQLTAKIRETNQFALAIRCQPAVTIGASGVIAAISRSEDAVDLTVWQNGTSLGIWFRNPLSVGRASLGWYIPRVFTDTRTRDILVSYDGSAAAVYLDGKRTPYIYRLGADTGFAQLFAFLRTRALPGYWVIYTTLIFLPQGILLGLTARRFRETAGFGPVLYAVLILVPPIILEAVLVGVSGRAVIFSNILLAWFFTVFGILLSWADGAPARDYLESQSPQIADQAAVSSGSR